VLGLDADQPRAPRSHAATDQLVEALVQRHQRRAVAHRGDHDVREHPAQLLPDLERHGLLGLERDRVGPGVAVEPAERPGGVPGEVGGGRVTGRHLEHPGAGLRHHRDLLLPAPEGDEDDCPQPRGRGTEGRGHGRVAG
jgi:hypothetical protein